jgi:hypothetical protein
MSRRLVTFICAAALTVQGQEFSQRGFMEIDGDIYPELTQNDMAHGIGEGRVRYEPEWKPRHWFTLSASLEAQVDSHRQVARDLHFDWQDRSLERPALSFRRLAAVFTKNNLTFTLGKQFIRWGEADFLNPTDRFAPKDLLNVVDPEILAVTAARITYTKGDNTFDFVWQPRFTPGRIPLINHRWTFLPAAFDQLDIQDLGSSFPGRSSFGARWNHTGVGYEYSLSYYDGFNYLPTFDEHFSSTLSSATFSRMYPALRLYGADLTVPLAPFTVKGEAAYFTAPAKQQDEYLLYVLELERQMHDLRVTFGYAGEVVTAHSGALQFAAEQGFARAVIGHAQYALDSNRTLTLDAFVRQNGRSSLFRPGYSQSFGEHWRATVGFAWLRGEENDFLGQYHRNSFAMAGLRYSF